jgi:hypothetical protein
LGVVLNPEKRPLGEIRDTVKLSLNTSELAQRKNIQYDSGFVLPPGNYHVKSDRSDDPRFQEYSRKDEFVVLASQLRSED